MGFSDKSCSEFVEVLATKAPVPGGGGASAMVGALATALGNMVGSLTVGKKKYAAVEEEMWALKDRCDRLQKDFLHLVERDAEVFEPLARAYSMPKNTEEEKAEKATNFILNTLKSLSPSLKMVNGPILESLELASRGVGVIFLNDEMNLGEPNFQTGSLNFLADGHTAEIYVGGKGVVPICRDYFYMGATQNGVGGDYVGTHKLNDALASRFKFVKMAKPSSILGILRTAGKQVDEATYLIIDKIYKEYMSGVESGTYPMSSLNIRGMKSAIEEVYYGASVKTAVAENINNSVQSDDDTDMLNTVVDTLVP